MHGLMITQTVLRLLQVTAHGHLLPDSSTLSRHHYTQVPLLALYVQGLPFTNQNLSTTVHLPSLLPPTLASSPAHPLPTPPKG